LGPDVRQAQQRAYTLAESIRFDGMQYRKDIGFRAV
ncbi:MAG: phosphoribosylglycinamide synthetase C domain-containing protein, partial [Gammaproteobacteria bacterium]